MKHFLYLFLFFFFHTGAFAVTNSVNLGGGEPGAPQYATSAVFPVLAPGGSLAVDVSTNTLYIFNINTLTWDVITGGGGGSGTVTSVSVVSANGMAGTVANATTTPAITLTTSITGLLKGNGTAISAAVSGTDYLAPFAGTTLQYVRGDGSLATLDSSIVPENTNLYFTDSRAKTAAVADAINNGTTDVAPSQNAVFDALALKADDNAVWKLSGNAGTGGTANIGTTDAQNFDIIAGNSTVATVVESYKGISAVPTVIPADATSVYQFDYRTYVSPTASTTGATHANSFSQLVWDNPNAGFNNASGSLVASSSAFNHNGSGTINYASTNSNNANFTNAGTTTQFKGVTSENDIATGTTVSDYYGMVSGLNTTGGIVPASNSLSLYGNFTNATIGNANSLNANLTFSGTTANSQGVTGLNSYLQFNDSTTTTNGVNGFSAGIDVNDTAAIGGITGSNVYVNMRDTATHGGLNLNSIGLNQEGAAVNTGGVNGFNANLAFSDTSDTAGVNIFNGYVNTIDTAHLDSLTGINLNPEIQGSSDVDNVTLGAFSGQIRGSSTVDNLTGVSVNPQMSGSAAVTNFTGLNVSPQVNGTSVLTNSLTGIQLSPASAADLPGAKGIDINMSGVTLSAAAIAAGEHKTAISTDGAISAGYGYTIPGTATFFQQHYLGGTANVANGDPVSAFGFGTNLAQTVTLHDDWTIDGSGLGYVDVGFVGALNFDTGTTMARWTGALGGAGNPGGAGTLTDAIMFRAAGILPQGGSLAVTNMYGFQVDPNLFGLVGTNKWGFFENGTGIENHVSRLAIGTSGQVAESGVLLDVAGPIQTNDELRLQDPGAGTDKITIQAPTLTGDYTLTLPVDDGASGECLKTDGSGVTSWSACTAGGGDVVGPASATDNALARFDGTTGKLIQDSSATLSDGGTLSATAFSGPLTGNVTGNADTATAFAANPTDCAAGTKATAIDASGNLTCSAVADGDISSGVDAAKIADGSVSNTEFQYINSLTSNVQTQLNGKQAASTEIQESATGTVDNSNVTFTVSQTPISNASVKLYQSGLILVQGVDYTISGSTITMTTAPNYGQTLYANYRY